MNNARRKQIAEIIGKLQEIDIESLASEIRNLADEEQAAFDNMPESLQQSDRGQQSEAAADALSEAAEALEGFDINEIVGYLETAGE